MSTQLLIYEKVTPLSKDRHSDWSVEVGRDYSCAKKLNALPLLATEFMHAAREYPIVFSKKNGVVQPLVLLGMRGQQNLYLNDSNQWTADYVPAFLRRYPFAFARSEDGKTFALCIDEAFEGFNNNKKGEPLFDEKKEPTPYVTNVLQFLQNFQAEHTRTVAFCKKLDEFKLLESHNAVWTGSSGEKSTLNDFLCVDRKKLQELAPKVLKEMIATGELDLIYAHLFSLTNFNGMKKRMAASVPTVTAPNPAPAETEPKK